MHMQPGLTSVLSQLASRAPLDMASVQTQLADVARLEDNAAQGMTVAILEIGATEEVAVIAARRDASKSAVVPWALFVVQVAAAVFQAITVRLSMAEMGAARTVKFVRLHLVLVKMLNTLLVPGTAIVALLVTYAIVITATLRGAVIPRVLYHRTHILQTILPIPRQRRLWLLLIQLGLPVLQVA